MKIKATALALTAVAVASCGGGSGSSPAPAPPPSNSAPTIGAIANKSVSANVQSAVGFTVSDENVSALMVTASSSNQLVLPDANLSIAGTGSARTLSVEPAIDTVGSAFVTIDVADSEGLSASRTFELIVDPQNASLKQFVRDGFASDAFDEPAPINAVEFAQDAEDDGFEDLLDP